MLKTLGKFVSHRFHARVFPTYNILPQTDRPKLSYNLLPQTDRPKLSYNLLPQTHKPKLFYLASRTFSSQHSHNNTTDSTCEKIYSPQKSKNVENQTCVDEGINAPFWKSPWSNPSSDKTQSLSNPIHSSDVFLDTVQATALKGIGVTCATGIVLSPLFVITGLTPLIIGAGGMFYTVYKIGKLEKQWKTEASQELNGKLEKYYWSLCAFSGSCLSPILMILGNNLWWTLPGAVGVTAGLMYGIGHVVKTMKNPHRLEKWQMPLVSGLVGLVALDLVGLGALMIVGPNVVSAVIHSIDLHAGILLMSGFVAYDTHIAKVEYEKDNNTNVFVHSTNMFLNLLNIIQRVLIVIAEHFNKK